MFVRSRWFIYRISFFVLILAHLNLIVAEQDGAVTNDLESVSKLLAEAQPGLDQLDKEGRQTMAVGYASLGEVEQAVRLVAGDNVGARKVVVELGKRGHVDAVEQVIRRIDGSEFGKYQRFLAYQELAALFIRAKEEERARAFVGKATETLDILRDYRGHGFWHSTLVLQIALQYLEIGDEQSALRLAEDLLLKAKSEREVDERPYWMAVAARILAQVGEDEAAFTLAEQYKSPVDRTSILIGIAEGDLARGDASSALNVVDKTNRSFTRARILLTVFEHQYSACDVDAARDRLKSAEAEALAARKEDISLAVGLLTEVAKAYATLGDHMRARSTFQSALAVVNDNSTAESSADDQLFGPLGKAGVSAAQLKLVDVAKEIFSTLNAMAERDPSSFGRDLKLSLLAEFQSKAGLCDDAQTTIELIESEFSASRSRLHAVDCLGRSGRLTVRDVQTQFADATERELALGRLADASLDSGTPELALEALVARYHGELPSYYFFQVARENYRKHGFDKAHNWATGITNSGAKSVALSGILQAILEAN